MCKVSIIIPAYNTERYLRKCIDSVLFQTLQDIEVICINDGSTDGTLSIMQEYAATDSRLIVINKSNTGYGNSMNVGYAKARGEYIGIVESDDYVKQDMYQTLYEIAHQNNLDIIKADFTVFMDSDGNHLDIERKLSTNPIYYNKVLDPRDKSNRDVFRFAMNTWSGIYRRSFLERFNILHNETPGASYQDNGFWFQTFCYASRIYFLDKPLYMNRRDNPNSSIRSKNKVFCMNEEYAFIYNLMKKNGILTKGFMDVFCWKKFQNYMFTFNRVSLENKLSFIRKFSEEFQEMQDSNVLCLDLFSIIEKRILARIIADPDRYYVERLTTNIRKSALKGIDDVTSILESSRIYKAGLVVTYLPRKFRDILYKIKTGLKSSIFCKH